MNEIDLIKEVEKHHILYDKTVRGFNKAKLRDDAWKQIRKALDVSDTECKKRWRSLRDSFIKLQRTHGNRTRWPYHHAMRFLIPHLEQRQDYMSKKYDEDSDSEGSRQRVTAKRKHYEEEDEDDENASRQIKNSRQNSTDDENSCHCSRNDPDELFLLSCAPILKRLNAKQSAVARLRIQQVLLEAEFGNTNDTSLVTPGSDCDLDNSESVE